MLVKFDGTRDMKVRGIVFSDLNILLDDNQFFQITPDNEVIELWEGKRNF